MMYKNKIRIATKEYCFLEIDLETNSLEESIEQHNLALKLYQASLQENAGIPNKDMCRIENDILNNQGGYTEEERSNMSPIQNYSIHRLENAINRIKNQ